MVKHNNVIANGHFRKAWQTRVKTWLDQAGQKKARRAARKAKAAKIAPRPAAGPLRPVVRCQTVRYNIRVRAGRGFTLAELKEAGLTAQKAQTIGIAVDHRRQNKSTQSLQANVTRLKEYLSKLVVIPKKVNKPKKGDATAAEVKAATQHKGAVLPIKKAAAAPAFVALTEELKKKSAYKTLRQERTNAKLLGRRMKKAKEAEEAAASAKPAAEE